MTQMCKVPYVKLIEWRSTIRMLSAALPSYNREARDIITEIYQSMGDYNPEPCECQIKPLSQVMSKTKTEVTVDQLISDAKQLESAIEEHKESANSTSPEIVEQPTVNSKNSRAWTAEEIAIIKSSAKIEDAVKYYQKQFGGRRNQNGVEQKWQKLRKDGKLILKGGKVKYTNTGSTYYNKIGVVEGFTEKRTHANVLYDGNVRIQIPLQYLEAVE